MNNLVQLAVFAALVTATAPAGAAQSAPRLESDRGSYEIVGVGTNGLQPDIYLSRSPSGWEMQIQFLADSPPPPRTWLKPTNIVGSEVALSLTNGTPIPTRSPDALAAYHLPVQTKVQEVLRGVPRSRRAMQWLPQGPSGTMATGTSFGLLQTFDVPPDKDLLLSISPLLYKVGTNELSAQLVRFPIIRLKLTSDGEVLLPR